ncbi:MAG: SDR family NAD(P)-dependent oxidoreductase [Myxococcota bacterium]|jgi:meso-butanediol dehydrogenase/(S,S)-butanediol dehydrogenase/diacetyl reductase
MESLPITTNRFEGRVALVTGAASGLGRCVALRLARESAAVVAVDIDTAGLEETAQAIQAADGRVETIVCDVRDASRCSDTVARAVDAMGRLDVLCNAAGVVRFHHFAEMPIEDWELILGVNLSGTAFMCRAAIPALLETEGNIVNVASIAALKGQAYTAAYTASKAAVVQLTRSLALEYIGRGIRINAVTPGGIETPMNTHIEFPDDLDWSLVRRYTGLRGMAKPEEVADAIAYIAAPGSRILHGAVVALDLGMSAD